MDIFSQIAGGFAAALTPVNLLMALCGAILGTMVGVLPGLGPTSALAILLPLTAVLGPTQAIIMMAGIYYGAMYGGSTTAILLNIPGEVSSIPTALEGYPLARQGRGGPALGIAAIGSYVAGTLGIVALTFFAPLLADRALSFGPPEYFSLMVLAFTVVVSLSGAFLAKGLAMAGLGYFLSLIGIGPSTGQPRFHFGMVDLYGGIELISLVIGLFAIAEVFLGLQEERRAIAAERIGSIFPSLREVGQSLPAMIRGGLIGFLLGLLPGCAPGVTVFVAYDTEKKVSKQPEKFGQGVMAAVASVEAANNATSSAGFIPLMALGIPGSPPLALLMGSLMIYGLQPGPMLFLQNPDFAWAVIASMYIGNLMLLVLNLPLVGVWVQLTRIPYGILGPIILALSLLGAYTVRNNMFDVGMALLFGLVGYFLRQYQWPLAPLLLSFILGPLLEKSLVQSLGMSGGSLAIFGQRGLSLAILALAAACLIISLYMRRRTMRRIKEEFGQEVMG